VNNEKIETEENLQVLLKYGEGEICNMLHWLRGDERPYT